MCHHLYPYHSLWSSSLKSYSTVQKECKRISRLSTKYNEISFEIRRIFEMPIVSVKTKIRKAARIFERNIAETQRNFESAQRKFAAKIRTLTAFRLTGKTNGYRTGYKRVTKPFETGYTERSNG